MAEIATLGLKVDGVDGIEKASDALDDFTKSSDSAGKSADGTGEKIGRFVKSTHQAKESTDSLKGSSDRATTSLGSLGRTSGSTSDLMAAMGKAAYRAGVLIGTAFGVNALKNYADTWSDMQSQVGAATGDMAGAAAQMSRLTEMANASYSPLQQTVEGYARNVATLRDLGKSSSEAADFTESLNHMLVLTATRGERAASVQDALAKAMAVGKLQADGLETVLANGGEVAQALAKELGTTVSGLRQFASDGKITGKVIADAVIKPLESVRARAAKMPATLTDAFVRVNNNLTEFVGRIDEATGASAAIADLILSVADGIRKAGDYVIGFGQYAAPAFEMARAAISAVAQYADIAVVALAGFYAPALIAGIVGLTTTLKVGLVGAIKAVTAAMLANPVGVLVAVLAAATYAAYKFRDVIQRVFGVDIVGSAKTAANYVIGSFVAAYEDVKFVFSNFGDIIGAAFVGGVNAAIRLVNNMIVAAKSAINVLINAINQILGVSIDRLDTSTGIQEIANDYAKALGTAIESRNKAVAAALSKDYIGAAVGAVGGMFSGRGNGEGLGGSESGGGGRPTAGGGGSGAKFNDDYIASMKERIALIGKETEYEQLLAKIRVGSVKFSSAAKKNEALAAAQTFDLLNKQAQEAEKARQGNEQNVQTIKTLEQNLSLAALRGEELAVAQAKLSLNQYATPEQIAQVEAMAAALYKAQEAGRQRDQFGNTPKEADKYILGDTSPLSGGVFDNQFARYEAEAEAEQTRYQEQLDRLKTARELQIETNRSYDELEQAAAQQHADRMAQIDAAKNSLLLTNASSVFSGIADIMLSAKGEQSGIYRAMFAASKAFAVADATVNAYGAISKAWNSAPFPVNLAAVAATAPQVLALVSAISGSRLSGMAHDGIDSVPSTGTWLLEKGERVTTAKTSARLDSVLERIDARQREGRASAAAPARAPSQTVNVIEDASRAGTTERTTNDQGDEMINIFIANIRKGGAASEALQSTFGLTRRGR